MRHAEGGQCTGKGGAIHLRCFGESLAQPAAGGVDVQLAARLWIDEPDVSDVRQRLLPRIPDLDRYDGVPRGDLQQR